MAFRNEKEFEKEKTKKGKTCMVVVARFGRLIDFSAVTQRVHCIDPEASELGRCATGRLQQSASQQPAGGGRLDR